MIFGDDDDNDDLGGFTYIPFQIQFKSEDEATITKGKLQSLHENINQLLLTSNVSSSEAYSKAAVESLFERITKEHTSIAMNTNKVVTDYAVVCKTMTEKIDKLVSDTTAFMEEYQSTYNNNTVSANATLQNLGSMFKAEKDN